MNRKMAAILNERQKQLLPGGETAPGAQPHHSSGERLGQQHSPRGQRPVTAGARPKVTCAMLNETERMLLKAPNRHKSMLSAGALIAVICLTLKGCSLSCVLTTLILSRAQASSSRPRRRSPLAARPSALDGRAPPRPTPPHRAPPPTSHADPCMQAADHPRAKPRGAPALFPRRQR